MANKQLNIVDLFSKYKLQNFIGKSKIRNNLDITLAKYSCTALASERNTPRLWPHR